MQGLFHRLSIWIVAIVLLLASSLPASSVIAQEDAPPARPRQPAVSKSADGPPGARQDANGLWRMAVGAESVQSANAASTGGPDDYGYVWDDSVAINWIDATDGTDTGLSGDGWDQRTSAIPLPFAFKYYEDVYSNVYISAAGYIAFQDAPGWRWPDQIRTPLPSVPNTVISPFSTPLDLVANGMSGRVFYKAGGSAPNRFFVVTWNDIQGWDSDERYTYQVVLYENGDILFQYRTMTWGEDEWYYCGYVGIEDADGLDGFGYGQPYCVPSSIQSGVVQAIRFTRPAPSARVKLTPHAQGLFTRAGNVETFEVTVINNGELGADTYNVTIDSTWPTEVRISGQALSDTNADGTPDTGSLEQGERRTLTVQVRTPAFGSVADANTATLNVRSTRNPAWQRSALMRTSIPTPFVQVYEDQASPGIRITQPGLQTGATHKIATTTSRGGSMAVAGTPSGGYVAIWNDWEGASTRVRHVILDRFGAPQTPIQNLMMTSSGWFDYLAAAVAPDGNIALIWHHVLRRWVDGRAEYNDNIYLSILDAAGNVLLAPTSLTNNDRWGESWAVNVPSFAHSQIAAADDNRFLAAWYQDVTTEEGWWAEDIYYTVVSSTGETVRPATQFPADEDWARFPRLASLIGNRFLLAYYSGWERGVRIAILDSSGNLTVGPRSLTSNREYPRAVAQMSNGSILAVWQAWGNGQMGLRYALLSDSNLTVLAGPVDLVNPFSLTGDDTPSIAVDAANRAVITWGEDDWDYRATHFYALIDGSGAILTQPSPWLAARTSADGRAPVVASSYNGYGVAASYTYAPTSLTQTDVQISTPALSTGAPEGSAQVVMNVGNQGLPTANSVVITAELDPRLTFLSANPAPVTSAQTASGGVYTWNAPNLHYLSQGLLVMNTGVPSATVGTRYPVTVTISTTSDDVNPSNNTAVTEIMVAEQIYLPVTTRSAE